MDSIKLNTKEIVHKHCLLVGKLHPTGYRLPTLKLLYMHIGAEQLGKWMAKSRNSFSYLAGWRVITEKQGEEARTPI